MTGEDMMPTKEQELADALAERLFPLRDLVGKHAELNTRLSIVETEARADRAANLLQTQLQTKQFEAVHANLADQDKKLDTLVASAQQTEGMSRNNNMWLQRIAWAIGIIATLIVAWIERSQL